MAAATRTHEGRRSWAYRLAFCMIAVIAVLAVVEFAARLPFASRKTLTDVVDIQTPQTLAAKVRFLGGEPGQKIVLLGDSLAAGQSMREHGDQNWRQHTISAELQRRFDAEERGSSTVLNLGMNGLLPADLETLVDALLPVKPDIIVMNVSLRSFSGDFAAPAAQYSRDWLRPGMLFRQDGSIRRLPDQLGPSAAIERRLLNHWATYRLKNHMRDRFLDGEPKDVLQRLRNWISGRNAAAGGADAQAEMRLLLQVRNRYANASLDPSNPQFAAWTRMLSKLREANQRTIIFYGTESPRLLPSLIDQARYAQLMAQLQQSIISHGERIRYIGPNARLPEDVFLDHVHVNAAGNAIYAEDIARVDAELRPRNIRPPPPAAPAAATTPAPAPVPLAPAEPLGLVLRPFIEKLAAGKTELGRTDDFSKSATLLDTPDKPRFDLQGFPVLSVETRGPEPLRDIIWLYHWWAKDGAPIPIRDSYHMLRASVVSKASYPKAVADKLAELKINEYIDVFAGIPARTGAAKTALYLQDSSMRSESQASNRSLTIFGHRIDRTPLTSPDAARQTIQMADGAPAGASPFVSTTIAFKDVAATDLTGRGVRFELTHVEAVFTIRANHDLAEHVQSGERLLGAMAPQVIGYVTQDKERRTLTFSGADLVKFDFDSSANTLAVEVYDYEFRERSTRGSMSYPNAEGKRIHPNLGIVQRLPAQSLTITHSRSAVMPFATWHPGGKLAALAFTEHADFVGVAQDTLTMFGSTEMKVVAGKGFLGNRIPLTKTIFPAGRPVPFQSRTASSEVSGGFIQATLESDTAFLTMLRAYRQQGFDVEVGIHCVGTSTNLEERKTPYVRRGIAAMAEFKPVTWVDHGGRDCLWESGWDPSSEHYIIPVLRENNFKYLNMLGDKYDGRYNMIADNHPSNLLFHSVGLDDDLKDGWRPFVFNTVPIGLRRDDFSQEHLARMIRARGLVNVHTYLPYEATAFSQQADGAKVLNVNPWYNQNLVNIANAARTDDLHLATTEKLNDFILDVRTLHVHATGVEISVRNPQGKAIPGLTIGYRTIGDEPVGPVSIRNATITGSKVRDAVNYMWFDLKP